MDVLRVLKKNRFLRLGVPFITLLVGGSFGLKYFAQIRYSMKKQTVITPEELEALGVKFKRKEGDSTSLDTIYEEHKQNVELDTWQNIRGPRPWEDSKEIQTQQREAQRQAGSVSAT